MWHVSPLEGTRNHSPWNVSWNISKNSFIWVVEWTFRSSVSFVSYNYWNFFHSHYTQHHISFQKLHHAETCSVGFCDNGKSPNERNRQNFRGSSGICGGAAGCGHALNRKVASSFHDGVIDIYHGLNPSGCTMALAFCHPPGTVRPAKW